MSNPHTLGDEGWVLLMPERSIYEQLTGVKVDDTTLAQLDFTKNSFIDTKSIEYWKGIITVSKILDASRTYPHGLVIPESGTIVQEVITAGDNVSIQPPGTEIWRITGMDMKGIGGSAVGSISYFDGSTFQSIDSGLSVTAAGVVIGAYGAVSDIQVLSLPIELTNSLYWVVFETGGANNITLTYSYEKLSL
jgi:hypothetical protein